MNDFGVFLENHNSQDFQDSATLPHPKVEILHAIYSVLKESNDKEQISTLIAGAHLLTNFQPEVGDKPVSLSGIPEKDINHFTTNSNTATDEDWLRLANSIVSYDTKKYEQLLDQQKIETNDINRIVQSILAKKMAGLENLQKQDKVVTKQKKFWTNFFKTFAAVVIIFLAVNYFFKTNMQLLDCLLISGVITLIFIF